MLEKYDVTKRIMTIEEHHQHWITSAANDLSVAQPLVNIEKFDWSLRKGQSIHAKILKATSVRATQFTILKSHEPPRLAETVQMRFLRVH